MACFATSAPVEVPGITNAALVGKSPEAPKESKAPTKKPTHVKPGVPKMKRKEPQAPAPAKPEAPKKKGKGRAKAKDKGDGKVKSEAAKGAKKQTDSVEARVW